MTENDHWAKKCRRYWTKCMWLENEIIVDTIVNRLCSQCNPVYPGTHWHNISITVPPFRQTICSHCSPVYNAGQVQLPLMPFGRPPFWHASTGGAGVVESRNKYCLSNSTPSYQNYRNRWSFVVRYIRCCRLQISVSVCEWLEDICLN
jgi:hypothetical protein